jgi:hypothetical protein
MTSLEANRCDFAPALRRRVIKTQRKSAGDRTSGFEFF